MPESFFTQPIATLPENAGVLHVLLSLWFTMAGLMDELLGHMTVQTVYRVEWCVLLISRFVGWLGAGGNTAAFYLQVEQQNPGRMEYARFVIDQTLERFELLKALLLRVALAFSGGEYAAQELAVNTWVANSLRNTPIHDVRDALCSLFGVVLKYKEATLRNVRDWHLRRLRFNSWLDRVDESDRYAEAWAARRSPRPSWQERARSRLQAMLARREARRVYARVFQAWRWFSRRAARRQHGPAPELGLD